MIAGVWARLVFSIAAWAGAAAAMSAASPSGRIAPSPFRSRVNAVVIVLPFCRNARGVKSLQRQAAPDSPDFATLFRRTPCSSELPAGPLSPPCHGYACHGHPRPFFQHEVVDARPKAGHDEFPSEGTAMTAGSEPCVAGGSLRPLILLDKSGPIWYKTRT